MEGDVENEPGTEAEGGASPPRNTPLELSADSNIQEKMMTDFAILAESSEEASTSEAEEGGENSGGARVKREVSATEISSPTHTEEEISVASSIKNEKEASKESEKEKPEQSSNMKDDEIVHKSELLEAEDPPPAEDPPEPEKETSVIETTAQRPQSDSTGIVMKFKLGKAVKIVSPEPPATPMEVCREEEEEAAAAAASSPPPLPSEAAQTESDGGFHGFSPVEIPQFVFDNFADTNLTEPFAFQPTIFVSISSKKSSSAKSAAGPANKGPSAATTASTTPKSATPSSSLKSSTPLLKNPKGTPRVTFAPEVEGIEPAPLSTPTPGLLKKKMNNKYFQPLFDGWVREIVYDAGKTKPDVLYISPALAVGQASQRFRSGAELEGYLITTGSVYPLTFFTFKKEPLGAPEGMEVVRINSPGGKQRREREASTEVSTPTLGKRVSKPPEKLSETIEAESHESKTSKRLARQQEKLESEAEHQRTMRKTDMSGLWKDPENIVQSPKKSVNTTPTSYTGGGLLKVKMFSKMNAKNVVESKKNDEEDIIIDREVKRNAREGVSSSAAAAGKIPVSRAYPMAQSKSNSQPKPSEVRNFYMPILPAPTQNLTAYTPATVSSKSAAEAYPNLQAATDSPSLTTVISSSSSSSSSSRTSRPGTSTAIGAGGSSSSSSGASNMAAAKTIVRPTRNTQLPCSIHCPGVTGFPSLACSSCHCMFHPLCVGLPVSFSTSGQMDFFCNDCQPSQQGGGGEPGIVEPAPEVSSSPAVTEISAPPSRDISAQAQRARIAAQNESRVAASEPAAVPRRKPKLNQPPRPLAGQTIVNIGGRKFLVVPRPLVDIDSPPPSPPTPLQPERNEKLPVLLEPATDKNSGGSVAGPSPRFELEQAADGRLILKPVGVCDPVAVFGARNVKRSAPTAASAPPTAGEPPKKVARTEAGTIGSRSSSSGDSFNSLLSNAYFAMLHVFRYLSLKDRMAAGRVCRMWRQLALNPDLWQAITLRQTKIFDWKLFGGFVRRMGTRCLDLRKVIFVKDRDVTWTEIISVAADFAAVQRLDFPRVAGSVLEEILDPCSEVTSLSSQLTTSPLDLACLNSLPSLSSLRLKSGHGPLELTGGLKPLERLSSKLVNLSLLSISGLKDSDYDIIGLMVNLVELELGDCSQAPVTIFKTLSDLRHLERIRLEKGCVGKNVSKLQKSSRLTMLELIDFQVLRGFREGLKGVDNIRRLLIIPTYKDEVAAINTEIVEGVTKELSHLAAFYLGVTNEWLEAMSLAIGDTGDYGGKTPGDKECFPLERGDKVEHISLPALYRHMCRELPNCRVKVLKMSAGATCKQFIKSLDSQQQKKK